MSMPHDCECRICGRTMGITFRAPLQMIPEPFSQTDAPDPLNTSDVESIGLNTKRCPDCQGQPVSADGPIIHAATCAAEKPVVPLGHFWRGEINPFICKNCGELHSAHIHTDEASRCRVTHETSECPFVGCSIIGPHEHNISGPHTVKTEGGAS